MKICRYEKEKVEMVSMTPKEAMLTIESLARQIRSGSPNDGRYECYAEDESTGTNLDFSISVSLEQPHAD